VYPTGESRIAAPHLSQLKLLIYRFRGPVFTGPFAIPFSLLRSLRGFCSGVSGRGGMGSHKHGISGIAGKSPKARHEMKRYAESQERKAKPSTCVHGSIADVMKSRRED